jgi:hypothetical protein
MKRTHEPSVRLFNIGLATVVCSAVMLTFTKLHYNFVFLPQYYGSFSARFQQKNEVNFEPMLAYLNTTAGMIAVALPLGGICLGFVMMGISRRR